MAADGRDDPRARNHRRAAAAISSPEFQNFKIPGSRLARVTIDKGYGASGELNFFAVSTIQSR